MTNEPAQYAELPVALPVNYADVLMRPEPRAEWQSRGACALDSAPFLMVKEDFAACKAVCGRCPVLEKCLAYAIANDERHGVWGGLTPAERREQKSHIDVSTVPLEFRAFYLEMEGRVKRSHPTPHYVRNPALDYVIDADFLLLIDAL